MHLPIWTALVTLAALLVYLWTGYAAGAARARHHVKAPAVSGPPEFERALRAQQNTLEQIVPFLPALWLAAYTVGDRWAAAIGLLWPVGRVLYARAYVRDPEKRGPGFLITFAATAVLLLAALAGLGARLV